MRLTLLSLLALSPLGLFAAKAPDFLPLPASVAVQDGRFKLSADTAIVAPAELANEANYLAARLRAAAELPAPVKTSGAGITLTLDKSLPAEGYTLEVTASGAVVKGGSPAGVFYGVHTLLQSLPAAVYGFDPAPKADWSLPLLSVKDAPATPWRGVMLDSSRHYQPVAFIKKFLDAMAAQKLNKFHWHLVDSESWRLEIKKYPKLTQVHENFPAYYREEIPTNPTFRAKFRYGHFHGGGYYTHADVREIVAYAKSRHIEIIPEIEFPGHAMAALTAYPEFSTTRQVPSARSNITRDLLGVHPEAIRFIKDVLDETMDLFPGAYIHFGGDEAPKDQWKASAEVQKKIDELGLRIAGSEKNHASEDALQAWFFNEMAGYVAKRGKRAVGWEEIMHSHNIDRLTKGSVIMPWLSVQNGVKSANAGYGVVHTAVGPFYLDSYQVSDGREPSALYNGPMTAEGIHKFDLFPGGLTADGRKNILGAQCQLWSELMPRTDDVEYQAFPRVCALAELTWTAPENRKDTGAFMSRLASHGDRLSALNLNHRQVSPAAALGWSPRFLGAAKDWVVSVPHDHAARLVQGDALTLRFEYRSGGSGLDITGVELLSDGKVVASDKHKGFTGTHPDANTYRLAPAKGFKAGKLELRILAKGAGGTDSTGDIVLSTGN